MCQIPKLSPTDTPSKGKGGQGGVCKAVSILWFVSQGVGSGVCGRVVLAGEGGAMARASALIWTTVICRRSCSGLQGASQHLRPRRGAHTSNSSSSTACTNNTLLRIGNATSTDATANTRGAPLAAATYLQQQPRRQFWSWLFGRGGKTVNGVEGNNNKSGRDGVSEGDTTAVEELVPRHMRASSEAAQVVPFALDADEALVCLKKYLPWLTATSVRAQVTHSDDASLAVFVPFYAHSATVSNRFRGTISKLALRPSGSGRSARVTTQSYQTEWHRGPDHVYEEKVPSLQAYAGFRYRRELLQPLRGNWVSQARPLLASTIRQAGATLEPFEMTPAYAWELTHARIKRLDTITCAESLQKLYAATSVRDLQMQTRFVRRHQRPVFMPVYVYEANHGGRVYRYFVSGVDGTVSGPSLYSPVGSAVGTAGTILVLGALSDAIFAAPLATLGTAVVAGASAAATAWFWPIIERMRSQRARATRLEAQRELRDDAAAVDSALDADHSSREGIAADLMELTGSALRDGSGGMGGGEVEGNAEKFVELHDPKGYYAALGLDHLCQMATKHDVKVAFRRRIWEVLDDDGNVLAVEEAYRCLRDHRRRAAYDGAAAAE